MKFKSGQTIYNFEEMTVITPHNGWWKLYFSSTDQELYRIAHNKFMRLSPKITKAYIEYSIEKILLGDIE